MHCFFAIKLLKISMFFFSKSKQKISTTTTSAVFQQLKLPIVCIDLPYSRSSHLGFGCIVMQSVFSVQCTPPSFKHPISGSPPSLTSSSSKEREKSETSREDPLVVVAAGDDENDHLEDETTTYLCSIACRYFCAHHTAAETQSSWGESKQNVIFFF